VLVVTVLLGFAFAGSSAGQSANLWSQAERDPAGSSSCRVWLIALLSALVRRFYVLCPFRLPQAQTRYL
jgi:hypothetical protein